MISIDPLRMIQALYAFGLGPNDALNQMNIAGATRATYVPDIQGPIVASLDAASGTLTKAGFLPFGDSTSTAALSYTARALTEDPKQKTTAYKGCGKSEIKVSLLDGNSCASAWLRPTAFAPPFGR
jgi:hypothetical protein